MNEQQQVSASDIPAQSWVDRVPLAGARPYLRLARMDRPIGTWLLLLPCWWATALAAEAWPDPWFMVLFAIGALVMRGAGCTVNDLADREFDRQVARTATRPIASGQVSVPQAFLFLALQLGIGLAVLLHFNPYTIALSAASLILVALYPFAKRVTYWPQFVLGLTFNWGALVGWTAVTGELALPAVVLYAAGILWTLGYDTIYAHQDKEDDVLVGIKSTALKFGATTGRWLTLFYGGTILLMAGSGYLAGLHWAFYAGLAAASLHLIWQVRTMDLDDAKNCLTRFKSNRDFGLIVLGAIVAGRILA